MAEMLLDFLRFGRDAKPQQRVGFGPLVSPKLSRLLADTWTRPSEYLAALSRTERSQQREDRKAAKSKG